MIISRVLCHKHSVSKLKCIKHQIDEIQVTHTRASTQHTLKWARRLSKRALQLLAWLAGSRAYRPMTGTEKRGSLQWVKHWIIINIPTQKEPGNEALKLWHCQEDLAYIASALNGKNLNQGNCYRCLICKENSAYLGAKKCLFYQ